MEKKIIIIDCPILYLALIDSERFCPIIPGSGGSDCGENETAIGMGWGASLNDV